MRYTIYHLTRFRYSHPVFENVMETRMHPLSDSSQRCLRFELTIRPLARYFDHVDYLGNYIQFFDYPGRHRELTIVAVSDVEMLAAAEKLPNALPQDAWNAVDAAASLPENWDWIHAGELTAPSPLLAGFAAELGLSRDADPLSTLFGLNQALFDAFQYDVDATQVDSPIEHALTQRRGVCQDYAHVMLALVRAHLGIPCRYVSGYLYHSEDDQSADGASHAWIDAWLPELGWVGFDPTNNLLAGERHVRVAVGRDYRDVPPTRGVFKGDATSELTVRVRVRNVEEPDAEEEMAELTQIQALPVGVQEADAGLFPQQQQQQQ
jgi:transglutaminase-like putative cysteine protease